MKSFNLRNNYILRKLLIIAQLSVPYSLTFAYTFDVTNKLSHDVIISNDTETYIVKAAKPDGSPSRQALSLTDGAIYKIEYKYNEDQSANLLGSIAQNNTSGWISISLAQSSIPYDLETVYAVNVIIGDKNFGTTILPNYPNIPFLDGCTNANNSSTCNAYGGSAEGGTAAITLESNVTNTDTN